ncbi:hypothetical protein TPHA_0B00780 [Tetrapisispora phaffii CBS 4417]|uniref:SYO1-like TPR repeats domain-containing protein n=1 Tax=Tetrapisispora phaffii (strain ATCC 24235 / CBS 4417 / NBRC 1672 / NRRL Y-8282 / UCD 70-5) TaxID=1071381 RepID=G8BQF3_TETPH|nr:hypothetical protein TPHA_0B00780 [Tetrapisispora phaffii CBS 4417]CCE61750.1 hypothetical protein TPHA_0B00780 [Tetrapisispora phaffii CBS 4417]
MGKSKKRSRTTANRLNPLRNGKSKNGNSKSDLNKDNATVTKKIQPLLKQLQSAVPNDRSMALSSVTLFAEDPYMRKLLLKEKLVQIILSRLLTDSNTDIIVESFGLLRNLVLEEGYDIATHLWRSNIWISITDGFTKAQSSLNSINSDTSKTSKESKRMLFDYIDNLLSLIVALANGSDSILGEILNEDKLNQLFQILIDLLNFGYDKIPANLFNTILDLIYDFSSESFEFIETISNNNVLGEFIKGLPELMKTSKDKNTFNELSVVLTQGIYLQFLDTDINTNQITEIVQNVLEAINDVDLKNIKENLAVLDNDEELAKADDAAVAEKIRDYSKKRNEAMMRLQSIEIAIDLITAVIEITATLYEDKSSNLQISDDFMKVFTDILPHVFQTLSEAFTSRILIAWNNLLWLFITLGVSIFELSNNQFDQLWHFIIDLEEKQKEDLGVKLGRLSVIWAILKTVTVNDKETISQILEKLSIFNNMSFINTIIEDYKSAPKEISDIEECIELKQRYCGILGTMASIQGQISINEIIGKFLLSELASKETPTVLLVEITNLLFEIYPDSNFDYDGPVFIQQGFLNILRDQVVPNLKAQFKFVDKNKDELLKEKCTETFNNLNSFINYKANEK